jgi:tRNA(Arg) A34 adenosine deaminase TadA
MKTPEDFMRYAIEQGRAGIGQKGHRPFAALIVKDGEIVAQAVSKSRSSNDPTAHGEVLAIREACNRLGTRNLEGCELYTTCEPCPLCVAAIWYARISRIYYAYTLEDCEKIGISTADLIDELRRPIAQRKLASKRILAEEARRLFDAWTSAPNFEP